MVEIILTDKFFKVNRDQVRKPGKGGESVSKGELIDFLGALADKELGFEKEREPSITWLRKILYSINPRHKILQTATMTNVGQKKFQEIEENKNMKEKELAQIEQTKAKLERKQLKVEKLKMREQIGIMGIQVMGDMKRNLNKREKSKPKKNFERGLIV